MDECCYTLCSSLPFSYHLSNQNAQHNSRFKFILYILIFSPVCSQDRLPFDCQEAYVLGCRQSGVYTIDPGCGKPFSVWCDMKNGGGWTVFQRRRDGSVDFYRGWAEYERGFGDVKGEHWLGLKKISCLTGSKPVAQLRVDLADFEGRHKYAHYSYFSVGNPSTNYTLSVGGYSGTAGDSLAAGSHIHNGRAFSTHDRDNDRHSGTCAVEYQGAWWYDSCHNSNLNGLYLSGANDCRGIRWYNLNTAVLCYSYKWSEMKLR